MKKTFLSLLFLSGFLISNGQPNISHLDFPPTVNLFDLFEISFNLNQYTNPYDPDTISVYAVFTSPDYRKDSVLGFYYEGYSFSDTAGYETAARILDSEATGWRIRFTPDMVGTWTFRIYAQDQDGITSLPTPPSTEYSISCQTVSNANGFIKKANNRYLKREVVRDGNRKQRSFFPVGPNVAWYSCQDYGHWTRPYGIYYYEKYIDSLSSNANYMRIFLNRYQALNLYGPEYTQIENGDTIVYFDSIINQKDAAELDYIVTYAKQNDISLMLNIFTSGDFVYRDLDDPYDANFWEINPYNTIVFSPCQFFEDNDAIRITKNLIRYIVARWGYATNILAWELWNEVTNLPCAEYKPFEDNVTNWHKVMNDYIRTIDPFKHCISTSMSNIVYYSDLYAALFQTLDFVQQHNYQNINKAKSKEQFSYILYNLCKNSRLIYPNKPFFMGEFGFGGFSNKHNKDPKCIDLHNSLWSSLFSSSIGPASFWWWDCLDILGSFKRFKPILSFCQNMPLLSDSFEPFTTGEVQGNSLIFENNIETYYLINSNNDTIYGWCQDTAFCYQSLRWLTDSVNSTYHFVDSVVYDPNGYVYTLNPQKKPQPSSNSNIIKIPIINIPVGTTYSLSWFNAETGLSYNIFSYVTVQQDTQGRKWIIFEFPSFIRNLNTNLITNTFGDFVFSLYKTDLGGNQEKNDNN